MNGGVLNPLRTITAGRPGWNPAWGVVENAEGGWNEGGVPPPAKLISAVAGKAANATQTGVFYDCG